MINLRRSSVAGEYKGVRQDAALVLRVDVGRDDSLDIISGDLLIETNSGNFEHNHSFQTTALAQEDVTDGQRLRGAVKIHSKEILQIARLDLEIPDEAELVATYTFYKLTSVGRQTALTLVFPLTKTAESFRRVELEIDQVVGVPLPVAFQTEAHPDTPPDLSAGSLTFQATYRKAGLDLDVTFGGQDVPVHEAGEDDLWTNEELHAAMMSHFQQHADEPQWRLYLLLATRYVRPGVLGIMFDSGDDFPRQGAAVFSEHPAIAAATAIDRDREYLYTIVHELGHAFNMLHSFQKGIVESHGVLPRPASLSWMNYPDLYPFGFAFPPGWDGSQSFWSQFRFAFDRRELAHVRHNDSLEVIMGGRSFGFAGHLEERPFEMPALDTGDLSLVLWFPPVIEFLQQLEGDIRLRNEGREPISVHPDLHPSASNVELLVRRHSDRFPKVYRNFYQACVRGELEKLAVGQSLYQEITPSFGLRHWFVDEPGTYEFQAVYRAPDGRKLASNVRRVRVMHPSPDADRLAPDFFAPDTGTYLGVEGSRAEAARGARDLLDDVCGQLPRSSVTKQIQATNALRDTRVFKDVRAGKTVRGDRANAASGLLRALDVRRGRVSIDPSQSHLRLARMLRSAAHAYAAEGQGREAGDAVGAIETMLSRVKAPKQATDELRAFRKKIEATTSKPSAGRTARRK